MSCCIDPVTSSTRDTTTSRDASVASAVAATSVDSVTRTRMKNVGMVALAVTVTVRASGRPDERRVGKDVSVRVDLGGRRINEKKITCTNRQSQTYKKKQTTTR